MKDVKIALQDDRLAPLPDGDDHPARIAYLVLNPASDPIQLDIGCPSLGYWGPSWPVVDGNHRLAAAIYRKDDSIPALVDGELEHAFELFQVDCEEPAFKCMALEEQSHLAGNNPVVKVNDGFTD
ncbi:hypothetical protein H8F21_14240 [Pseudomonas sp. P66]|uniref:ParB/Sulfiredoxin domain-containing protein n=1 Tax=Pseudomonas arcuscaelestis TaxID=2710591 RepID=A0ABS2BYQ6_9PSED|nr:hypothetical protein [Pseudomonas arcuscaelestis]MBM5458724.1 hypothetical protein [Pseudomonas arcuscaelestis]